MRSKERSRSNTDRRERSKISTNWREKSRTSVDKVMDSTDQPEKSRKSIDRLLISKAEKATKVLEVVSLKSSLAQASLLESRKLIAEVTRSIESINGGRFRSHDTGVQKNRALLDNRSPNGYYLSSVDCKYENIDFDNFLLENANHPSHTSNRAKDIGYLPPPLQLHDPKEEESELQVEES